MVCRVLTATAVTLCLALYSAAWFLKEQPVQHSPGNTTYYLDAMSGDDASPGTSPDAPWKSLGRLATVTFSPGDRILLKSGAIFQGQLRFNGSGTEEAPITVDRYEEGPLPVINGSGLVEDAVLVHNQEYVEIRNLEVTNRGESRSLRRGVHIVAENIGTLHHIHIQGLKVHDVNGIFERKENGGIIWSTIGNETPSRFIDLRIEDCRVFRVDRSGIVARSFHARRSHWFPSLEVVIRNNVLDDIGGDGITPWACDGALIEHNVASNCNSRANTYNAGIWPWSCDNTVIQYNEVYLTRTLMDGQGFDSDYNSRNTLFQYNYSHDNEGGFMLICADGGQSPDLFGNTGTIVRYNISQNDGERVFHFAGPAENSQIYNNTIFIGKGLEVDLYLFSNWDGWATGVSSFNNVFIAEGNAVVAHETGRNRDGSYDSEPGVGNAVDVTFDSNVYYGDISGTPSDPRAILGNHGLVNPGSGDKGLDSLDGYRLLGGSPGIDSGLPVPAEVVRDFFGVPVPQGKGVDRGASEFKE